MATQRVATPADDELESRRAQWLEDIDEKGEQVLANLDDDLKKDRTFMMTVARGRWYAVRYAAPELASDREFVLKARLPLHVGGIMTLPYRMDEEWLRAACGEGAWDNRFFTDLHDNDFCLNKIQLMEVVPQISTSDAEKSTLLHQIADDASWLSVAAEDVRADPEFMQRALKTVAQAYRSLPDQVAETAKFSTFGALNVSLADGATVLLDGSWLLFYASGVEPDSRGKGLPRRQNLPEAAIYKGPLFDLTVVLTLSYCWATPEHPDPDGAQLQEVARMVECLSRTNDGRKVVVFWDWTAFPQHSPDYVPCEAILDPSPLAADRDEDLVMVRQGHHLPGTKGGKMLHVPRSFIRTTNDSKGGRPPSPGEGSVSSNTLLDSAGYFKEEAKIFARFPRTTAEEKKFQAGLGDVDVWFANRLTTKVLLTTLPKSIRGNRPAYRESGWPTFENIISRSISDDQHVFDAAALQDQDLDSVHDLGALAALCGDKEKFLPMTPDEFRAVVSQKTFLIDSDLEFVTSKYASTYNDVVRPRDVFEFPHMGDAVKPAQWASFFHEIIPDCRNLLRLDLQNNPKTCAIDVAELADPRVIVALAHLQELQLSNTAMFGDVKSFASLRRLRKLDLQGLEKITGDVASLSRLIEMRELVLNGCWRLKGDISTLKRLQDLAILDIDGCVGLRSKELKDQLQEFGNILPNCTLYYMGPADEPTFQLSRFHTLDVLHQQQRPVLEYEHNKHWATNNHRGELDGFCVLNAAEKFACHEHDSHLVTLYSARSGEVVKSINAGAAPMGLCHIPEVAGSPLFACCANSTMVRFNHLEKDVVHKTTWTTPDTQMCMCWQPLQKLLYSGSTSGKLYAWDIEKGQERACFDDHSDIVMKVLSVNHLGNIITASLDSTINVWDSFTGVQTCTLSGHTKGVNNLAYNHAHRFLISCGFDHDALIWSPFDSKLLHRLKGHSCALIGCHAVEGTSELITADVSGQFKLWDLRHPDRAVQTFTSDHEPGDLDDLTGKLNCFSHIEMSRRNGVKGGGFDGYRIIAGSKKVLFFDQQRAPEKPATGEKPIRVALYNAESLTIFTASERNVTIWDANLGSKKHFFGSITPTDITSACLDGMMTKFILGEDKGDVSVFDYQSGKRLARFAAPPGPPRKMSVVDLVYIPASHSALAVYLNGTIRLYDVGSLALSFAFKTADAYRQLPTKSDLSCVCYTKMEAQGGLAASVGTNRSDMLMLWDVDVGRCEYKIQCGEYQVTTMTFLEPHPLLAVATSDHHVRIWGVRQSPYKGGCVVDWSNNLPEGAMLTDDLRDAVIPEPVEDAPDVSAEEAEEADAPLEADVEDGTVEEYHTPSDDELFEADRKKRHLHAPPTRISTKVSRLSWDATGECLFTGDDAGHLRKWCLSKVLAVINNSGDGREELMYVLARKAIEEGRDMMSAPEAARLMATPEVRAATSSLVEFSWGLEMAHDEVINCMKLTSEPRGILTSSEDRCVRLWTLGGDSMGELQMDTRTGKRSPGWELKGLGAEPEPDEEEESGAPVEAQGAAAAGGVLRQASRKSEGDEKKNAVADGEGKQQPEGGDKATVHQTALRAVMAVQNMEFSKLESEDSAKLKPSWSGGGTNDSSNENPEVQYVGDPKLRAKKRHLPPEVLGIVDPLKRPPIALTKLGSGLQHRHAAKQKAKEDSLSSYLDRIASKSEPRTSRIRQSRSAVSFKVEQEEEPSLVPPSPRRREDMSDSVLSSMERLGAQLDDIERDQVGTPNIFEGRRSKADDFRAKRLQAFKAQLQDGGGEDGEGGDLGLSGTATADEQ